MLTGEVLTDKVLSEKVLSEKGWMPHELFEKTLAMSSNPIFLANLKNWTLQRINESFALFTGYPMEELVGYNSSKLSLFLDKEQLLYLKDILINKQQLKDYPVQMRLKSGGEVKVAFTAEIVSYRGYHCILGSILDISEQERIEEEMVRLDRLNRACQLAAITAHEIRNPMTAVRGFLQLLHQRSENSQSKDCFELMISELDRANSIITEFLSLAVKKDSKPEKLNLNEIINSLKPLLISDSMELGQNLKLSLHPVPSLLLDGGEIRQLILNLARNGLEAMTPQGVGILEIQTKVVHENVILVVQDQGSGICPEIMKQLGTPFVTTKEKGTGLGLAVCFKIAKRNEAEIEIDSRPTGTKVIVKFPLKRPIG